MRRSREPPSRRPTAESWPSTTSADCTITNAARPDAPVSSDVANPVHSIPTVRWLPFEPYGRGYPSNPMVARAHVTEWTTNQSS